jgi:hypothetical protein
MNLTKLTQSDIDSANALKTAKEAISNDEAYLLSTDWYVARYAETGTEIPDEVKTKRATMRTEISELRAKYNLS